MNLDQIQSQLREQKLDGWWLFDHHYRDPIAYRVLGLPSGLHVTRRWYYLIPVDGAPRKLVHRIESKLLDSLEGTKSVYSSWEEQTSAVHNLVSGCGKVAMQYSGNCAIPYISNVDGGTIDLIRSTGAEVVTSAELIQFFEARLNERSLESHLEAGVRVDAIRAEAFQWIGEAIRAGHELNEWQASEFIRQRFALEGLVSDNGPIVAVDAHAGDPHYEPASVGSARIQPGSFVLLDMWAKLDKKDAIFYDITWTGFCGDVVPDEISRVFHIVRDARKAAAEKVIKAFELRQTIRGFEVDDAARNVITDAGFRECFVHRTGHSIGIEVHANGANMDNLETHDERVIIPWSCFSIEPGIYLENFGVRSEIDMFVDDVRARVTGEEQDSLVLIV